MVQRRITLLSTVILVASVAAAAIEEVTLIATQYPEKTTVQLDFTGTQRAPDAHLQGKITFRDQRAR